MGEIDPAKRPRLLGTPCQQGSEHWPGPCDAQGQPETGCHPPATKSGLPFKTTNCSLPGTLMQRHAVSDVHERKRQPHCRAGHHTVGIGGQKKNVSQAGGIKRPDHHHCRPWCGERRGDGHPHHGRGVIGIALVALVVGRIVIVMLISVMKQTREIGLVKVTAATNGEILNLLLP